jgi:hypothetical protein
MRTATDTSVREFSAGYAITEFEVELGGGSIQMSSHRANDIREWWFDEGAETDVPVVLRADNRHLVPEEADCVDYERLRVPGHMSEDEGVASVLIPTEKHTRLLMGFDE